MEKIKELFAKHRKQILAVAGILAAVLVWKRMQGGKKKGW
jgi:hypothetical protein